MIRKIKLLFTTNIFFYKTETDHWTNSDETKVENWKSVNNRNGKLNKTRLDYDDI